MSFSANSVSEHVEQLALAAIAEHPLQKEATGWSYCVSDVFEQPKKFIEHLRLSEVEKVSIQSALHTVDSVLVVSYWTSERKPEPLAGYGKHYAFFVHPTTFSVLHSGVGTWRS